MKITEKYMGFQILLLQFREALYAIILFVYFDNSSNFSMSLFQKLIHKQEGVIRLQSPYIILIPFLLRIVFG